MRSEAVLHILKFLNTVDSLGFLFWINEARECLSKFRATRAMSHPSETWTVPIDFASFRVESTSGRWAFTWGAFSIYVVFIFCICVWVYTGMGYFTIRRWIRTKSGMWVWVYWWQWRVWRGRWWSFDSKLAMILLITCLSRRTTVTAWATIQSDMMTLSQSPSKVSGG